MKRFKITMYHNGRANKVFFPTLEAASKVANDIFTRQGIVVGVEAVNTPQKWYVGVKGTSRVAFRSAQTPTPETGYNAVIGPFRTKRAARFMVRYGNNPHCQCVADAERLAKLQDELKKKYGKEKSEPATLPRRL